MDIDDARLRLNGRRALLCLASAMLSVSACTPVTTPTASAQAVPVSTPVDPQDAAPFVVPVALPYRIVARLPHDPGAFTQGLFWRDGKLFESTGRYGQSRIRIVAPDSGNVLRETWLDDDIFGEGLATAGERLASLSWRSGRGFLWDPDTLAPLGEFTYEGEGWGLAATPTGLVMSDGTDMLRFLDPESFAVTRQLQVTLRGQPLRRINELEWIDGAIYANIWQANVVLCIDPESGAVTGAMNLEPLTSEADGDLIERTPNGLAWDAEKRQLYVTGKLWPTVFVVEFE